LASAVAYGQSVHADLWGVDNTVLALARSGNTLYVGGAFNWAGPCTGGLAAMPKHTSTPLTSFPKVTGYIACIASDGEGGWFLAGDFTAVGGKPRFSLAHVLPDGSVAPWDPNPTRQASWLLVSGNTVYVSGFFATISGRPRQYIAALDATTGEALDWDAHSNGIANPLALHGDVLYVGGGFSRIGGE